MYNVKPLPAILGVGAGVALLAVLSKKAKASTQANASTSLPSSTSPATPPTPPLLGSSRTSSAEEGLPLAWDKSEHPLADRGVDDADGGSLDVREIEVVTSTPASAIPATPTPASSPAPATPPAPSSAASTSTKTKTKTKPSAATASSTPATPPAPSSKRSPREAAQALYDFATNALHSGRGADLGTKGHPSSFVRAAQQDMGGVTADGFYGPATKDRGRALIGKTFPTRK